jgi:hypothetical protein
MCPAFAQIPMNYQLSSIDLKQSVFVYMWHFCSYRHDANFSPKQQRSAPQRHTLELHEHGHVYHSSVINCPFEFVMNYLGRCLMKA